MIKLSPPPENMNSIREACGIVGTPASTAFVGNLWATGWLLVGLGEAATCATPIRWARLAYQVLSYLDYFPTVDYNPIVGSASDGEYSLSQMFGAHIRECQMRLSP